MDINIALNDNLYAEKFLTDQDRQDYELVSSWESNSINYSDRIINSSDDLVRIYRHKTNKQLGLCTKWCFLSKNYHDKQYFKIIKNIDLKSKYLSYYKLYESTSLHNENKPARISEHYDKNFKYLFTSLTAYYKDNKLHNLSGPSKISNVEQNYISSLSWNIHGQEIPEKYPVIYKNSLYKREYISNCKNFLGRVKKLILAMPKINYAPNDDNNLFMIKMSKKELTKDLILDISLNFDRNYGAKLNELINIKK